MSRLYRMHPGLPSLPLLTGLGLLIAACEGEPPPQNTVERVPDAYLERLQEAEAIKHAIEKHELEQRRLEQLLGNDQAAPVTR